jgi:hypothetical protein
MVLAFAVVTLAGMALIAVSPSSAGGALTPVLLLQLFAASSGFAVPARRGHYDLLLTIGHSRTRIAVAHWLMSILPGLAGWLLLSLAELVVQRGPAPSIASSGSFVAMVIVSTLPWAITVALPRFAGAIGWMVCAALIGVAYPGERVLRAAGSLGGGGTWIESVLALVLYPPTLVGEPVAGPQGLIVLPGLLLALAAMALALGWIHRHDIPLEAAQ